MTDKIKQKIIEKIEGVMLYRRKVEEKAKLNQILKEIREDIKEEVKKMIDEEMNHNSGDWSCEICKKRDVILKKLENL